VWSLEEAVDRTQGEVGEVVLKSLTIAQIETIISAAERLNAKYPPSVGEIGLDDDITPYMNDSNELRQAINALSQDARIELVAVMLLGREREKWTFEDAAKYARRNSAAAEVEYIAEKALRLPLYLRTGMKKAGLAD
jgi:hypothetical protein